MSMGGKLVTTTGPRVKDDAPILYRAAKHDCADGPEVKVLPKKLRRGRCHTGSRRRARQARAITKCWGAVQLRVTALSIQRRAVLPPLVQTDNAERRLPHAVVGLGNSHTLEAENFAL